MVDKERYDRLLENSTIIADALSKYQSTDMVEVVRCKDCKYFEYNHWEKVNRVPLILAHEICTRWGEGCKTSEDGYCFTAERKEVKDAEES